MQPEKEFFEHLQQGRFLLQRVCSAPQGSGFFYPPRMAAPGSGETDLEWAAPSGLGTVYSTTVIRQKPPTPHYNLALVDLAEGPRLMARVDGIAPEAVKVGMAVRARVIEEAGQSMVVFEPVNQAVQGDQHE
jgi:hypothetical protein